MWNSKNYAAMAALGMSLAVAAATPASAQWLGWGGAYGYTGGCGAYGYAPVYGYAGGCGNGAYGYAPAYAGVYSYGWPYGAVGYGGCGSYGYAPTYGYAGGCGYGAYGYAPAYGYASYGGCGSYGYAPAYYGSAGYGYGCRARHQHGYGGYASAYLPRSRSYAFASRSDHRQVYASADSPRYSSGHSIRRHLASAN